MQIIKSFIKLFVFICPVAGFAQSTYLNQGSKDYHFIDRLEIKQQTNTDLNFSTLKPYNRRYIVQEASFLDSARFGYLDSTTGMDKFKEWTDLGLTPVDEYNLQSLFMNSSEWYKGPQEDFASRKPILKAFYKTKANFYEVNTKDFFLAVNPVLQLSFGKEKDNDEALYLNSRGITIRGMIGKKVGFSAYMTENQERGPSYFKQVVGNLRAVPGVGFYKPFKTQGVDYFDARGYITFNAAKFIDFQLGYDKNFIGNGYRSLFLSDWGNSYLFAKINTRIWKFNYQNIFMELMPQFTKKSDDLLPRKYAAMHHLSMNVTKWLNIGLFEGVVFGRKDHFDFQYLNPIIFYRHIEGTVGSPDNAMAGLDFKANVAHRLQFYGQVLLDEFKLDRIKDNNGWWGNKYGFQLGAKYIDAFGVKNLDLQGEINRVRPFTYSHYDTIANFYEVNTKDFFLAVNPVLQLSFGKEKDNDEALYLNSRGITIRGMIGKKVGFSAYMTENQERGPSYFKQVVGNLRAVPGVGFYKPFKTQGVDYFDARGYITFNAAKFIDFQLGYDKNFIGNGYRSLFLSDWGNSYLFAKINTRIWKFNYQNIFMELMPQFTKKSDDLLPRKYAAMHHLSMNVTKWLNIGLFEGVVFGRKDHFDFQYLNPIIFYRHIEGTVGSPDNAMAGLDFKANVAHRLQFYGQVLLDEFKLDRIKDNNGWWGNKYGFQLGAKYIDAFGVKNLDLQGEINRVRPFTYSHYDTIANYTHYNQPLAHPLGANFNEVVGIINYQPAPKWYIYARALFYQKGLDSTGYNAGGNIFRNYTERFGIEEGYDIAGGRKLTVINALLSVSYEWRQNLFFDLSLQQRNYKIANVQGNTGSTFFTAGVRLNMFKRQYDY